MEKHLAASVDTVRTKGPLEAFRVMRNEGKIKHLGSAYFTKWLYFTSALDGPDDSQATPILDQQVAVWLKTHAEIHLDINRTESYARYLDLLATWGETYGRSRVQVEKAIFGLATGRAKVPMTHGSHRAQCSSMHGEPPPGPSTPCMSSPLQGLSATPHASTTTMPFERLP